MQVCVRVFFAAWGNLLSYVSTILKSWDCGAIAPMAFVPKIATAINCWLNPPAKSIRVAGPTLVEVLYALIWGEFERSKIAVTKSIAERIPFSIIREESLILGVEINSPLTMYLNKRSITRYRLEYQDTSLSRRRRGFNSPPVRTLTEAHGASAAFLLGLGSEFF
jgi:hypothetical protein